MKKAISKNKQTTNTPNPQKSSPQLSGTIKNSKKVNDRYTSINLLSTRLSNHNPHLNSHLNSPTSFVNKTNLMQTPNTSKIFFLKNKFSNSKNQINNPLINMVDSSFKENVNPNRLDHYISESNLITKSLPPKTTPVTTIITPKQPFITSPFQFSHHLCTAPKSIYNEGSSLSNEIKARMSITSEEAKPEQLASNNQRSLIRTNSLYKLHVNSPKMSGYHLCKTLSIGSMETLKSYPNSHTKLNNTSDNTSNIIEHHLNIINDYDQISSRKSNGSSERTAIDCAGDTQERCINHPHKKVFIISNPLN